jgi:hypothetical protein
MEKVIVPVRVPGAPELMLAVAVTGLPKTGVVVDTMSARLVTAGVMVTLTADDIPAV